MARPTAKPRVPALDPERVSIDFVRTVIAQWCEVHPLLEPVMKSLDFAPSDSQLKQTRLYRDLLQIARLAVHGEHSSRLSVDRLMERFTPLLQSPLLPPRDMTAVLSTIDPDEESDPVKLVIAAAAAREQIAVRVGTVTSSQLAIVAGLTRRHVGAAIRDGQLAVVSPGKRGTAGAASISTAEARRWLATRGIRGYQT